MHDGVSDIIGPDHIHGSVAAGVAVHLEKFPDDRVNFQDLLDLLEKTKSHQR